jgi:DMSO/TMAO reductase YedYZ molybdopterin-dependent catalytic subunit
MARTGGQVRWKPSMVIIAAIMVCGLASTPAMWRAETTFAATPVASPVAGSADETIEFTGLIAHPGPVSVSELQNLPSETVAVTVRWRARSQFRQHAGASSLGRGGSPAVGE